MAMTAVFRRYGTRIMFGVAIVAAIAAPAKATEIQRVVSAGGVEAWLVEEHTIPLISVDFAFRAGAAADPQDRLGVANLLSTLLDEGAGDMDAQAFQTRLEELAVNISFNASRDNFDGSMKTLTRNADEAFQLLALAINQPRFDDDAIERMRAAALSRLRQAEEDPDTIAARRWFETALGKHPYARPVMGTQDSLHEIKADDLRAARARLFTRDRLKVAVVGDIDAAALKKYLDLLFANLPATSDLIDPAAADIAAGPSRQIIDMDIPQTVVMFGHAGIARKDPDFIAAYVLNEILGGGTFSSRLYDEVREKRGLAYSVYTNLYPLDHAALFIGGVATQNDRAGEALAIIERELQRLAAEGPTEEELASAKSHLTGSYALRFDSSGKIANALVAIQLEELGIDYINKRNDMVNAVTIEQIKNVAARLLAPGHLITTIVGRPTGLEEIRPRG